MLIDSLLKLLGLILINLGTVGLVKINNKTLKLLSICAGNAIGLILIDYACK